MFDIDSWCRYGLSKESRRRAIVPAAAPIRPASGRKAEQRRRRDTANLGRDSIDHAAMTIS
jgi:hypothetical protein